MRKPVCGVSTRSRLQMINVVMESSLNLEIFYMHLEKRGIIHLNQVLIGHFSISFLSDQVVIKLK